MRISLGVIAVSFLLALAAPARADVVTLKCISAAVEKGTEFTIDMDFSARTVTYSNTGETRRVEITDRYINVIDPLHGKIYNRIDRRTGISETIWSGKWVTWSHCQRIGESVL